MRLLLLFMLAGLLHVSAATNAQTVTLKGNHLSFDKVLQAIRQQTGYTIFTAEAVVKNTRPISVDAKNMPVDQFLETIFTGLPLEATIENKTIVIKRKSAVSATPSDRTPEIVSVQQRVISGQVTDADGVPLAGVTVRVSGTNAATTTNTSGRYELQIPEGGTALTFTNIGYITAEHAIGTQTALDAVLQTSVSDLDEVVVVGYGTVKKRDLTGAVTVIKGSEVSSAPVASMDQALQGKAAGVYVTSVNGAPGSGTTIRIRGGNSISASNEPLYVVDGFIGGGNLASINPADISSIEILKDASATAIYGARGANGVVLITTKQGREGSKSISANIYTGVQQLPREIDLLDGPQLAEFVNERAALLDAAPIFADVSSVTTTNWQDEITRDAAIYSANLAFEGGSEHSTYYLAGNYFDQDGVILNSGFKRYQTRLNLNLELTNWLNVGANINFSRTNRNNNKVNFYDLLKSAPTTLPVFDENGDYTIVSNLNGQTFENPVAVAKNSLNNTFYNNFLGNWFLQAHFNNGLTFKSTFGVNSENFKDAQYTPGGLPLRSTQKRGGYAYLADGKTVNILNENTVDYAKKWEEHSLSLLGGFTVQSEKYDSFSASGDGFSNDLLTYNNLSTGNPLLAKNTSNSTEWTIISFLGRLNYSFMDRYLFTVSARQDGSSRLSANNKWAFFPSAAFAWRMGDEDFIKNIGWFDDLKMRASYGKTGNQAVGVYSTLASLSVSNAYFNGIQQTGYVLGNIPNDNLKWETTDQYNLGLDVNILRNRLAITLDAYYKKTHNLLLSAQIPGTTGYTSRLQNIGTLQNKGLELNIDATLVNRSDFYWDLGFNIAANRNKVLNLGTDLEYRNIADGARLIIGEPAPVFFGAVYEGTYKSQQEIDALPEPISGLMPGFPKYKDVNGNGGYDGLDDHEIIGDPEPTFFGGFSSSLRYKRLSVEAYFQYSYGNDIINSFGPRLFMGEYASNVSAQQVNRWTPENNQSDLPRVASNILNNVNTQAYSFAVQDGSFLRLKTLQVSYNITSQKLNWLKDASIFFTGSNLWLLDRYEWGYDPEVNSNGTAPVLRGFDGYSYPQNRSYTFGLNVKF